MAPLLDQKPQATKSTKPSKPEVSSEATDSTASDDASVPSTRKRKREDKPVDEIEIDVSAPEPPSKKALRKAKKSKTGAVTVAPKTKQKLPEVDGSDTPEEKAIPSKRSEHGIWIGNLPWTATKVDVQSFITSKSGITKDDITRLHMPAPSEAASSFQRSCIKPQNKGFAYVDFATAEAVTEAVGLSEKLLTGRRVLIKDSKSFEGRPEKPKDDSVLKDIKSGKPPSKRIFVGNLAFETTKEDLEKHFQWCGEVLDVHVATFEDSGKCKGYAWVEFEDLEASEAAMRGWVLLKDKADGDVDSDDEENAQEDDGEKRNSRSKKKRKPRKWWVNRLKTRPLRMEFAEDKAVRYKKRFGKEGTTRKSQDALVLDTTEVSIEEQTSLGEVSSTKADVPSKPPYRSTAKPYLKKVDARTIKPGAALASAPRLTGAIVQSKGQKISFD